MVALNREEVIEVSHSPTYVSCPIPAQMRGRLQWMTVLRASMYNNESSTKDETLRNSKMQG